MTTARQRYPQLLSPFRLGPVSLANRAVISGHSMHHGDGRPGISDRYRAYLVARARGGAALVGIESAPMHGSTINGVNQVETHRDEAVPSLARLAREVHDAGSKLSIILWHAGHNVPHRAGHHAVAPSPIPSFRVREVPKPLTRKEIAAIVEGYGAAARRCRSAGVDVIEVQTATDYLLGSFLSPTLNRRTDEYGGTLENRARALCEALDAVRRAAGDQIAVGVRTSIAHLIPTDPDDYGLERSLEAMQLLARRGLVDYVSLITGSHWSMPETIPPMTKPRPQIAEQSAIFKRTLNVPVTVAGRIRTAGEAEAILRAGHADLIAMARTWIAEPEWIKKLMDDREDEIRPCMTCNQACIGFVTRGLPGSCNINPVAGREIELGTLELAAKPKRIAVVGGGPAGLETARVAALRGHRVTLYEASARLGGQMRLAAEAPHRREMLPAIEWWQRELERLQVRIELNRAIRPDTRLDADEVVWALGGAPAPTAVWRLRPHLVDGIPGTAALAHGRDIIAGRARATGKVLVIDEEGGWPAISLAETLAGAAAVTSVTVVTSEASLGGPELVFTFEDGDVPARIRSQGIVVETGKLVAAVEDGSVTLADGSRLGPFDTIVLSTGTLPRDTPEDALAVGDCVAPRGIWGATHDAARLARAL
jgi:2,4-dienoyl-CoA reductase-like NADH-dependent reductase (Old Yellow Enzyme family)